MQDAEQAAAGRAGRSRPQQAAAGRSRPEQATAGRSRPPQAAAGRSRPQQAAATKYFYFWESLNSDADLTEVF